MTVRDDLAAAVTSLRQSAPVVDPREDPLGSRVLFADQIEVGHVIWLHRPMPSLGGRPGPGEWWVVLDIRRDVGMTSAVLAAINDGWQESICRADIDTLRVRVDLR